MSISVGWYPFWVNALNHSRTWLWSFTLCQWKTKFQTFVRHTQRRVLGLINSTTPVMLSSFSNLRKITWHGYTTSIFQYAAKQLSNISSPCKITEVVIWVQVGDEKYETVKEEIKTIEEILISDKFPSLHSVQLRKNASFDIFPELKARGLLGVSIRLCFRISNIFLTFSRYFKYWVPV